MLGGVRLLQRRRPNVDKLKRKGDIDGLLAALRYQDTLVDAEGVEWDRGVPIRVEAAAGLAEFYGPAVGEALAEALEDDYPAVRRAAVEGISELGVPTAVEPLVDAFVRWEDPPDGQARERALETLVGWRLEGLAEAFAEHLLPPDAGPLEDRHRDALARLLAVDPRGAAAGSVAGTLVSALRTRPDHGQAARAERVLAWLGPSAGERLLLALGGGDVSPALVRAAGTAGDSRAIDPLVRLIRGSRAETRRAAAVALGGLRDTRAVPALLAASQDPDRPVRDAASEALNGMGMAAVIVGLAALLRQGGGDQLDTAAVEARLSAATGESNDAPSQGARSRLLDATSWAGEAVHRLLERGD